MDVFRSKRSNAHESLDDGRPAKRISTPAGQRLSMIIESTQALRSKSPAPAKSKINVTTTSTYCNDPSHQHIDPVQHGHKGSKKSAVVSALTGGRLNTPRESSEDQTPNGSALSVSVWSDKDAEKFGRIRPKKQRATFGQWNRKRLAIILAILLAFIIALAVGLAVGLKKKSANRYNSSLHIALAQNTDNLSQLTIVYRWRRPTCRQPFQYQHQNQHRDRQALHPNILRRRFVASVWLSRWHLLPHNLPRHGARRLHRE
jgi:hypothetical protein